MGIVEKPNMLAKKRQRVDSESETYEINNIFGQFAVPINPLHRSPASFISPGIMYTPEGSFNHLQRMMMQMGNLGQQIDSNLKTPDPRTSNSLPNFNPLLFGLSDQSTPQIPRNIFDLSPLNYSSSNFMQNLNNSNKKT
jgi:hypothetical protein